jgi:hypothetical protein
VRMVLQLGLVRWGDGRGKGALYRVFTLYRVDKGDFETHWLHANEEAGIGKYPDVEPLDLFICSMPTECITVVAWCGWCLCISFSVVSMHSVWPYFCDMNDINALPPCNHFVLFNDSIPSTMSFSLESNSAFRSRLCLQYCHGPMT